jgi:hypothetical protein
VLGALVAFDLGVLERRPVARLVAEAADVFVHDLFDRNAFEFLRSRMPCGHGRLLWFDDVERNLVFQGQTGQRDELVSRPSERQQARAGTPVDPEKETGVPGLAIARPGHVGENLAQANKRK